MEQSRVRCDSVDIDAAPTGVQSTIRLCTCPFCVCWWIRHPSHCYVKRTALLERITVAKTDLYWWDKTTKNYLPGIWRRKAIGYSIGVSSNDENAPKPDWLVLVLHLNSSVTHTGATHNIDAVKQQCVRRLEIYFITTSSVFINITYINIT